MSKEYAVRYARDLEAGVWVAIIECGASCVTQGRSIREARARIREALALFLEDEEAAEAALLDECVELPAGTKRLLDAALEARERSLVAQDAAKEATAAAAQALVAADVSTRDAAELLGISHQAVHQYATGAWETRSRGALDGGDYRGIKNRKR